MNEFQRHKKGDKVKWVITGVAFVLVFVMLVGLCLQLFGTGKQKPSEWFKKPEITQPQTESDVGELSVSTDRVSSIRLASASALSESDGQVVSVANAIDGYTYEWTLSGISNPSEYVSLSATTGTSVTVSAKKAFGSQITLTCTAKLDGTACSTATCTIDYRKRAIGMWYGGTGGTYIANGATKSVRELVSGATFGSAVKNGTFNFAIPSGGSLIQYSDGTVAAVSYSILALAITESTTDFGWTVYNGVTSASSFGTQSFALFVAKYQFGDNSSALSSFNTMVSQAPEAAFQQFYVGVNGAKPMSGKTFTVKLAVMSNNALLDTLTYNFTIPTDWGVAYTATLNTNNVIL